MYFADVVKKEYAKNEKLKQEDVQKLKELIEKEPHLPQVNDLLLILFLTHCDYSVVAAKKMIERYYEIKLAYKEMFEDLDPRKGPLKENLKNSLVAVLPDLTPAGYRVIYCRRLNPLIELYDFHEIMKLVEMVSMLYIAKNGLDEGYVYIIDQEGLTYTHMSKSGPSALKKYFYYLQEATPVRFKNLHFINVVPLLEKMMSLIKTFVTKDIVQTIHVHNSVENLYEYVPKEILPKDIGGQGPTFHEFLEIQNREMLANADFLVEFSKQNIDKSKRLPQLKDLDQIFGTDGTFKQLSFD